MAIQIKDKYCKIEESKISCFLLGNKPCWKIRISGEAIEMPICDWAPNFGTFEEFIELSNMNFNPFTPKFHITMHQNEFYFSISGETIPMEKCTVELYATRAESEIRISVKGISDLCYDEMYESAEILIESVLYFDGVYTDSDQVPQIFGLEADDWCKTSRVGHLNKYVRKDRSVRELP